MLLGAEYSTMTGNSNTRKFRGSGPWYDNSWYDYSSFDGRRWAAHSGSDSDDFILYSGINFKNKSLLIYYSHERKGLLLEKYPEIKYELLLNYNHRFGKKINLKTFFEYELHNNYFFINRENRSNMAISLHFQYSFN